MYACFGSLNLIITNPSPSSCLFTFIFTLLRFIRLSLNFFSILFSLALWFLIFGKERIVQIENVVRIQWREKKSGENEQMANRDNIREKKEESNRKEQNDYCIKSRALAVENNNNRVKYECAQTSEN